MKSHRSIVFALLLVLALGCSKQRSDDESPTVSKSTVAATAKPIDATIDRDVEAPSRIILFVGDGMGINYVTAGAYAMGGPLEMMKMPHFGWMKTHQYEFPITDSAASATAMATGQKTHYEGVAVKPGTTKDNELDPSQQLKSVVDWAAESGLKTGLVATSRITHATPAAFAAHRAHRSAYEDIALDMSQSGVNLMMGAGLRYFENRKDGRNLLEEMHAKDYRVVRTVDELRADQEAEKVVALLHEKDMPRAKDDQARALSLAEMVDNAVSILDRGNPKGWFLVVEGSMIDWCGHELDPDCALAEVLDFDEAVSSGLKYARDRDDTLVAVTADHETGGLTVLDPRYANRFTSALGGEEAINKALKLNDASHGPSPDPVQHFKLGAGGVQRMVTANDRPAGWGMDEVKDARMSLTWGFLSLASRPVHQDSEFYAAHTLTSVPIFTEGPGAEYIANVRDNADLGQALIALVRAHATEKPTTPSFQIPNPDQTPPRNVILFIGDGLGINSLSAAAYASGELAMTRLPARGFVSTHGLDTLVNDSAAGATAYATGQRTRRKTVGMVVEDGMLVPGESVLEKAERLGYATGIVSTTQLTHATPASFYAHVDHRRKKSQIAADFVSLIDRIPGSDGIEIAIGGGRADFSEDMRTRLRKNGYTIRNEWSNEQVDENVLMLLAPQGLEIARDRKSPGSTVPELRELVSYAIDKLSAQDGPFFLVVEAGQIDWLLHDGVTDSSLITEIQDMDDAVTKARDFAARRGDTLVVVTSDHDHTLSVLDSHYIFAEKVCGAAKRCGGDFEMKGIPIMAEKIHRGAGLADATLQGDYAPPEILLQYTWPVQEAMRGTDDLNAPHSASFVPIYAFGPWSHRFVGYVDQPEVGQILHEWAN